MNIKTGLCLVVLVLIGLGSFAQSDSTITPISDSLPINIPIVDQEVDEDFLPDDEPEEEYIACGDAEYGDVPYAFVKSMPYYEFCDSLEGLRKNHCTQKQIIKLIRNNYIRPKSAEGITGAVYIRFVVNREGEIDNVTVLKGVNSVIDQAVIIAVQKLPDFIPGQHLGEKVSVYFTVPVKIN